MKWRELLGIVDRRDRRGQNRRDSFTRFSGPPDNNVPDRRTSL